MITLTELSDKVHDLNYERTDNSLLAILITLAKETDTNLSLRPELVLSLVAEIIDHRQGE